MAFSSPAVADTLVGASGTLIGAVGVTGLDAADGGESPAEFVATTVKV